MTDQTAGQKIAEAFAIFQREFEAAGERITARMADVSRSLNAASKQARIDRERKRAAHVTR